jgi:hypothetical protein
MLDRQPGGASTPGPKATRTIAIASVPRFERGPPDDHAIQRSVFDAGLRDERDQVVPPLMIEPEFHELVQ